MLTIAEAAARLKMGVSEVLDVNEAADGSPIITTYDHLRYIDAVTPDAAGKTGLMFLEAPIVNNDYGWQGDFPVYAHFGAGVDAASDISAADVAPAKGSK